LVKLNWLIGIYQVTRGDSRIWRPSAAYRFLFGFHCPYNRTVLYRFDEDTTLTEYLLLNYCSPKSDLILRLGFYFWSQWDSENSMHTAELETMIMSLYT